MSAVPLYIPCTQSISQASCVYTLTHKQSKPGKGHPCDHTRVVTLSSQKFLGLLDSMCARHRMLYIVSVLVVWQGSAGDTDICPATQGYACYCRPCQLKSEHNTAAASLGSAVKAAIAVSATVALAAIGMIVYMLRMTRMPAVRLTNFLRLLRMCCACPSLLASDHTAKKHFIAICSPPCNLSTLATLVTHARSSLDQRQCETILLQQSVQVLMWSLHTSLKQAILCHMC